MHLLEVPLMIGKQLVSVGEDGACLVWNLFVEEIFPECFANAPA